MLKRYRKGHCDEICEPSGKRIGFILNHKKTDFYDISVDDFWMTNYEPMKPQLKLDLGI